MHTVTRILKYALVCNLSWMAIVAVLWLMVGCGGEGANTTVVVQPPHTPPQAPIVTDAEEEPAARPFPLVVNVIDFTNGTVNAAPTRAYVLALLTEVNTLVEHVVTFQDVTPALSPAQQRELFATYTHPDAAGSIIVAMSLPETPLVRLFHLRALPGDGVYETALVWLHQLFHVVGLEHEPSFLFQEEITADNAHEEDAGRQLLIMYRDTVVLD